MFFCNLKCVTHSAYSQRKNYSQCGKITISVTHNVGLANTQGCESCKTLYKNACSSKTPLKPLWIPTCS